MKPVRDRKTRATLSRKKRKSLVKSIRGGTEFIEKILLIGLFAFVVAIGVREIGTAVQQKMSNQGAGVASVTATIN